VKFRELGLDLLPEAISTSTRTLLASLGVADPGDGGPLPSPCIHGYVTMHH